MRWPTWLSSKPSTPHNDQEEPILPTSSSDKEKPSSWFSTTTSPPDSKPPVSWTNTLNSSYYSTPEIVIPTVLLTGTALAAVKFYTLYLRRIPTATYITPTALQGRRSIFGYVTAVGDGDTFRLYHTPGGRLLGWGWLRGRRVHEFDRSRLKENTIQVRIAGIDAPELAHFGKPEQRYGREALEGLRGMVQGRFVRARLWRLDQYQRVVGTVTVRRWGVWPRDVGLLMLKEGHATVYEAKFGSEFGGMEETYREAEVKAKKGGAGLWKGQGEKGWVEGLLPEWLGRWLRGKEEVFETPRQFKDRTGAADKEKKEAKK